MGYKLATLLAGRTRSAKLASWLPPAGLAERKPSRWRRSSGSAPMRERTSWADTVFRAVRSFSVSAAAMSRYTPQWMSGSFSCRCFASSSAISRRLASAVTLCL